MTTDLHKRLEEAAEKYQKEYETTERVAFTHGAVWGYKEAVAMAKEWLSETSIKKYLYDSDGRRWFNTTKFTTDFETNMNKLWEKKK